MKKFEAFLGATFALALSTSCEGSGDRRPRLALSSQEYCVRDATVMLDETEETIRINEYGVDMETRVEWTSFSDDVYITDFKKCTKEDYLAAIRFAKDVLANAQENEYNTKKIKKLENTDETLKRIGIKTGKISAEDLVEYQTN